MFVSPMLLSKSDKPFNDNSYITELKLDGIRMILSKTRNKVKLYTRHNNEVTTKFPQLLNINIPGGTILDGEIIVPGYDGKPNFELMMERFMSKKSDYFIQYCVFDIIYYKGKKVTDLPLLERKKLLESILPEHPNIVLTQWLQGNAEQYFELVKQQELEGIVMKKSNSKYYVNKRSENWLKVINYQFQNCYITGINKVEFGIMLSFLDGKYAGVMKFMQPAEKKYLFTIYKDYIKEETSQWIYLNPGIEVGVKYRNLTSSGLLRIPSFNKWAA